MSAISKVGAARVKVSSRIKKEDSEEEQERELR